AGTTWAIRRDLEPRRLAPFLVAGLIGVPIGVWLLGRIDAHALEVALGIFLAGYGAYALPAPRVPQIEFGRGLPDAVFGRGCGRRARWNRRIFGRASGDLVPVARLAGKDFARGVSAVHYRGASCDFDIDRRRGDRSHRTLSAAFRTPRRCARSICGMARLWFA